MSGTVVVFVICINVLCDKKKKKKKKKKFLQPASSLAVRRVD